MIALDLGQLRIKSANHDAKPQNKLGRRSTSLLDAGLPTVDDEKR